MWRPSFLLIRYPTDTSLKDEPGSGECPEERGEEDKLREALEEVNKELQEVKATLVTSTNRPQKVWKANCAQLREFDAIIQSKDKEIALLKVQLSEPGDSMKQSSVSSNRGSGVMAIWCASHTTFFTVFPPLRWPANCNSFSSSFHPFHSDVLSSDGSQSSNRISSRRNQLMVPSQTVYLVDMLSMAHSSVLGVLGTQPHRCESEMV